MAKRKLHQHKHGVHGVHGVHGTHNVDNVVGSVGSGGLVDPTRKHRGYFVTHDNGGRPYKVVIIKLAKLARQARQAKQAKLANAKYIVMVYKHVDWHDMHDQDVSEYESRPMLRFAAWRVFVPRKANIPAGELKHFDPGIWCDYLNDRHDEYLYYDGHMIVCQVEKNRFVYIGTKIYSFNMLAKPAHMYSAIFGSDVVYACLIDAQNNIYFLTDAKIGKVTTNLDDIVKSDNFYYHYFGIRRNLPIHLIDNGYVG